MANTSASGFRHLSRGLSGTANGPGTANGRHTMGPDHGERRGADGREIRPACRRSEAPARSHGRPRRRTCASPASRRRAASRRPSVLANVTSTQSRPRGRPAGQRVGAEPDRREQHAAEQDRDHRLLAPPPVQRLGQPPGLFEHDHGVANATRQLSRYSAAASEGAASPAAASADASPAGLNESAAELMQ